MSLEGYKQVNDHMKTLLDTAKEAMDRAEDPRDGDDPVELRRACARAVLDVNAFVSEHTNAKVIKHQEFWRERL